MWNSDIMKMGPGGHGLAGDLSTDCEAPGMCCPCQWSTLFLAVSTLDSIWQDLADLIQQASEFLLDIFYVNIREYNINAYIMHINWSKKDPKRIKDPPSGSAISEPRSGAEPYAFWSDLWKSPPGPRWQDRLERLGYTSNGASNVSVLSNSWKDVKICQINVKGCQILSNFLFMSFMSFLFSFCLLCPWSRNLVLFKLNLQRTEQGSSGVDLSCLELAVQRKQTNNI